MQEQPLSSSYKISDYSTAMITVQFYSKHIIIRPTEYYLVQAIIPSLYAMTVCNL